MESRAEGWFELEVVEAGAGTTYRFSLDGAEAFPDPRSPWQPEGIGGPSRVVDHSAFAWTDAEWRGAPPAWLAEGAIYEAHIGTFSPEGTFDGAVGRLDHLTALGVRALEIMPVAEFPGSRGWGYDGVFLYAPHHAYGGPEGLKRLVDACHSRGLGVILDVVYNHLGPDGNVLERYGPYFTDRYQTPWGKAVNLDGAWSDEVRRFFIDNALMWLADYHIDALRIDAVHAIVDTSARHFLEQLATETEELAGALRRPLVLVAESDLNDPRVVRARSLGGYGLDAVWNEDFHHALHAVLTAERDGYYADFGTLEAVAACLERGAYYDGRYSRFRKRSHGRPPGDLPGRRFVGFLQNHDQVGNRAMGERSAALMSLGCLKIGAALLVCAPFIPMLFQGEEWGASTPFLYFTDHRNFELGVAVREGRRREFAAFGWDPETIPDPQDPGTFELSKLDWGELDKVPHAELLDWHRRLLELRRLLPDLRDDRMDRVRVDYSEKQRWLRVRRGSVQILANLSDEPATLDIQVAGDIELASDPKVALKGDTLALPGKSVAILGAGAVSDAAPGC
jgi:maltooligosyltrehalose trehalohydrolase